jgi:hypothetical protein
MKVTFLAGTNKKRNVEIDSPAYSGGHGKCFKYSSFLWCPLEAALSIFKFRALSKNNLLKRN